jgi:mono/diheme cytochrome c family protein
MKYPITIMAMLLTIVPMAATAQTDPVTGKQIFEQMCAGCHGTRGDGGEGHSGGFSPVVTSLGKKEYMNLVSDEFLMLTIKKGGEFVGRGAAMPAWEKRLNDDEIRSIIAHIRKF